jgi:hypothetical protein
MDLVFAVPALQSAEEGRGQDGKSTKDQKRLMEAPIIATALAVTLLIVRMI